MALDVETTDGKTLARLDDLERWAANPREASDQEIDRLADEIERLGQYKPLIVDENEGVIVGGNMRSRALEQLDEEHIWVSLVDAPDEQTRLEYALSDNDRVGHYDREGVANLISRNPGVDITDYKVDFYAPQDLAQNLATELDAETMLNATDEETESDVDDADADVDDADDEDDSAVTPRSMEHLGEQTATVMVQLFMTKSAKEEFTDRVVTLKQAYGLDTTTDVVEEAVRREAEAAESDDAESELTADD